MVSKNSDAATRLRFNKLTARRQRDLPENFSTQKIPPLTNDVDNSGIDPVERLNRAKQAARVDNQVRETAPEEPTDLTLQDEFRQMSVALLKSGLNLISSTGADGGFFATVIGFSNTAGAVRSQIVSEDQDQAEPDRQKKLLTELIAPRVGFSKSYLWNTMSALASPIFIAISILSLVIILAMFYNWFTTETWQGWFLSATGAI